MGYDIPTDHHGSLPAPETMKAPDVKLPLEPTAAMIASVAGIVSPYAAKRIWEQMVLTALISKEPTDGR